MSEFGFVQEIPMFHTVGMLREILKNYSDDTTLYVGQSVNANMYLSHFPGK